METPIFTVSESDDFMDFLQFIEALLEYKDKDLDDKEIPLVEKVKNNECTSGLNQDEISVLDDIIARYEPLCKGDNQEIPWEDLVYAAHNSGLCSRCNNNRFFSE